MNVVALVTVHQEGAALGDRVGEKIQDSGDPNDRPHARGAYRKSCHSFPTLAAVIWASVQLTAPSGSACASITGLNSTKAFVKCEGTVYRADATVLDSTTKVGQSFLVTGTTMVAGQILTNAAGVGTSAVFPDGEYQVRTKCKEEGDVDYQDPITPVRVTVTSAAAGGGSTDFGLDDLLDLFAGFGS